MSATRMSDGPVSGSESTPDACRYLMARAWAEGLLHARFHPWATPGDNPYRAEAVDEMTPPHDCESDGRCCSYCTTHLGCHCGDEGPYGGY